MDNEKREPLPTSAEPAPKPISASAWKAQKNANFKTITLPSGATVSVKPLELIDCIASGYLPLDLFQSLMTTAQRLQNPSDIAAVSTEDMNKLLTILRRVAVMAVVEPKVVLTKEEETDDVIWVEDVSEEDLLQIFGIAVSQSAMIFAPFRR